MRLTKKCLIICIQILAELDFLNICDGHIWPSQMFKKSNSANICMHIIRHFFVNLIILGGYQKLIITPVSTTRGQGIIRVVVVLVVLEDFQNK